MKIRSTTILTVRHNGRVALGGDGQVTMGQTVVKSDAVKIRRLMDGQVLVGFALETENENENALLKLQKKNGDYIVLNSLKNEGAGFGHDTNKITIFDKKGNRFEFETKSKKDVAIDIINTITRETYA